MWKFGLATLLFFGNLAYGQDQFLREVTRPSGPSQILLSGGVLNRNIDSEDTQTQQVSAVEQNPEQQDEQAIPFQSNGGEQAIPQNGDENNPFDNGENGFGLRLSQSPGAPPAQQSPPANQPAQQQSPVVSQQQHQQPQQQGPILQQTPLTLPPLPAGHQYVDEYGNPLFFTQPHVQVAQPQPAPTPVAQVQQPAPAPVQQTAFVDTYGRQVGGIQTHQVLQPQVQLAPAPVLQEVIQPAAIPVAHKVFEHTLPLVQKVAPPPLAFHTYAVPAIHKVGNLAIPYAQKVVYAKQKLDADIVHPPTVLAPAIVKSKHRTVFSPVKVVQPVAPAVPVVKEVSLPPPGVQLVHQFHHAAPQQILVHQQQPQLLVHQPQVAVQHVQPPPPLVHVEQPQVTFQHPQPLVQFYHQPQLQYLHHGPPQAVVPIAHHPPVQYVEKQLKQLVHLTSPHVVPIAHPPVLVKKVKKIIPAVAKVPVVTKTIVPDFTLIHQPILSKVLFQRHIFNVKHGSEPLVYQDLCTVYPYQKNLRACALKKATLPELHHPDIRTVNVVEQQRQQPQPDQTIITGGAAVIVPAPPNPPTMPTVTVTRNAPKNIQETIKRESTKSKQQAIAAATAAVTTTVQPETAESRTSATSRSTRRKKGSNPTPPVAEKKFMLA